MRKLSIAAAVALFAAACSDAPTPTAPITVPTVQLSHVGGDPATEDLCGGLSPCDAYDYDRNGDGSPDGLTGAPGICFLPPTVDNHLSDPACSGTPVSGLSGLFKLAWCEVAYAGSDGSTPPSIVRCQDPSQWQDLVESSGFYSASVRWTRGQAAPGTAFRLYVVAAGRHWAHRDVVVDPNQTRPSDDYLHAIGYGTEPIKVRITQDLACVYFDTQGGTPENAATCLIAGATSFSFQTDQVTTTFNFPDGNPSFLADFEVSECLALGFDIGALGGVSGNALVDTPLADCKISMSSQQLESLTVPAQIQITVNDSRWVGVGGPFGDARLNVLQYDEFGIATLPPTLDPGWFGAATSSSAMLRALDWGMDKLARLVSFLGPEPLYAWPGAGFDFTRMSDFQVAVMPVMTHDATGSACASGLASCLDLGTFGGSAPQVPVAVKVSAPPREGSSSYDVPDTRLHFFPENGSVVCPAGTQGPLDAYGRGCYPAGTSDMSTTPPSTWDHLVVVTGLDGRGVVDWALASGANRLHVSACGVVGAPTSPTRRASPERTGCGARSETARTAARRSRRRRTTTGRPTASHRSSRSMS